MRFNLDAPNIQRCLAKRSSFCVYILTNRSGGLYVGVTSDLYKRLHEHRTGVVESFASAYKMERLVYFEATTDVQGALEREKEIKKWRRAKKIALIASMNPKWLDLSDEWRDPREVLS